MMMPFYCENYWCFMLPARCWSIPPNAPRDVSRVRAVLCCDWLPVTTRLRSKILWMKWRAFWRESDGATRQGTCDWILIIARRDPATATSFSTSGRGNHNQLANSSRFWMFALRYNIRTFPGLELDIVKIRTFPGPGRPIFKIRTFPGNKDPVGTLYLRAKIIPLATENRSKFALLNQWKWSSLTKI